MLYHTKMIVLPLARPSTPYIVNRNFVLDCVPLTTGSSAHSEKELNFYLQISNQIHHVFTRYSSFWIYFESTFDLLWKIL